MRSQSWPCLGCTQRQPRSRNLPSPTHFRFVINREGTIAWTDDVRLRTAAIHRRRTQCRIQHRRSSRTELPPAPRRRSGWSLPQISPAASAAMFCDCDNAVTPLIEDSHSPSVGCVAPQTVPSQSAVHRARSGWPRPGRVIARRVQAHVDRSLQGVGRHQFCRRRHIGKQRRLARRTDPPSEFTQAARRLAMVFSFADPWRGNARPFPVPVPFSVADVTAAPSLCSPGCYRRKRIRQSYSCSWLDVPMLSVLELPKVVVKNCPSAIESRSGHLIDVDEGAGIQKSAVPQWSRKHDRAIAGPHALDLRQIG